MIMAMDKEMMAIRKKAMGRVGRRLCEGGSGKKTVLEIGE